MVLWRISTPSFLPTTSGLSGAAGPGAVQAGASAMCSNPDRASRGFGPSFRWPPAGGPATARGSRRPTCSSSIRWRGARPRVGRLRTSPALHAVLRRRRAGRAEEAMVRGAALGAEPGALLSDLVLRFLDRLPDGRERPPARRPGWPIGGARGASGIGQGSRREWSCMGGRVSGRRAPPAEYHELRKAGQGAPLPARACSACPLFQRGRRQADGQVPEGGSRDVARPPPGPGGPGGHAALRSAIRSPAPRTGSEGADRDGRAGRAARG